MEKLAIKGGEPVRRQPFPGWPVFDEKEEKALLDVLKSRKWWYGEKVKEFEEKFASFQDAKYGISVVNGTAAIEISLIACGIGAGDEVIVPPYTFVATASAVLKANAIPVFVDIDAETWCIDPEKIEEAITEKTKAIIPVHFAGYPADMDKILEIAKRHNLKVIEDACHAWGTKWKGKGAGAIGDLGCFSFQYSKNITAGEGGIILTDQEELADLCRSYSHCGRGKDMPWYEHYLLGGNYRMTEFQAAILLSQLTRLEEQTSVREENAGYLDEDLAQIPGLKVMKKDQRITRRSYHLYTLRYDAKEFGLSRKDFLARLNAELSSPEERRYCWEGYPHPLYKNPLFLRQGTGPAFCPLSCPYYNKKMDYTKVSCPACEKVCEEEAVWITHPVLLGTKKDMSDIAKAVEKIKANLEVQER